MNLCEVKLQRAFGPHWPFLISALGVAESRHKLIGGLGGEKARWGQNVKESGAGAKPAWCIADDLLRHDR